MYASKPAVFLHEIEIKNKMLSTESIAQFKACHCESIIIHRKSLAVTDNWIFQISLCHFRRGRDRIVVPITIDVLSSNLDQGEAYNIMW